MDMIIAIITSILNYVIYLSSNLAKMFHCIMIHGIEIYSIIFPLNTCDIPIGLTFSSQ